MKINKNNGSLIHSHRREGIAHAEQDYRGLIRQRISKIYRMSYRKSGRPPPPPKEIASVTHRSLQHTRNFTYPLLPFILLVSVYDPEKRGVILLPTLKLINPLFWIGNDISFSNFLIIFQHRTKQIANNQQKLYYFNRKLIFQLLACMLVHI